MNSPSAFYRRRPLFWLSICFCAGVACDALAEPSLPALCGLASLTLAAVVLLCLLLRRKVAPSSGAVWVGAMVCGLVAAFAGGMLANALRWRIPPADDVSRLTPAQPAYVMLHGTMVEVSRSRPSEPTGREARASTWTIAVQSLGVDESSLRPASGRVSLKASLPSAVGGGDQGLAREGDVVELRALLDPLPEMTLPDGFDYGANLLRQGIRRVGAVYPDSVKLLAGPRWWRLDLILRRCSAVLAQRVEELLPKAEVGGRSEGSQAALLNALVLGRRERLDAGDREAFGLVGTAHLLAISGLQIHFLAAALWWLCRLLGLKRRATAWLVLLLCLAYCPLAGANTPVMRATVMIVMYLGAVLCWREPDSLSILGGAALLILFFSPGELFSVGFQLSFLAVLALLTICPVLNDSWFQWRKTAAPIAPASDAGGLAPLTPREHWRHFALHWLPNFARQALFVSLAAWVGTAPVVAWHMGRFATWSLLVNLLAVPLSSVCMLSGLALLALSIVSGALAWCAGWVAWAALASLQWVNAAVAALPGASIDVSRPSIVAFLPYAALWAWVWVERGRRATLWRTVAALMTCLLLLHAGLFFPRGRIVPSMTVLDLRHGRAALIETELGAMLIDSGTAGDGLALAELLRRRGTARLELLVISEDGPDAIGGACELAQRLPLARVVLPRAGRASPERRQLEQVLAQKGTPYGTPRDLFLSNDNRALEGSAVVHATVGDLCIAFCDDGLPPDKPASTDSALCTRVDLPGVSLLFAGIRSGAALRRLLAKTCRTGAGTEDEEFLKADVLRLSAGPGARWPPEMREFVARTGCSAIIAGQGSDPEEAAGLDLAELARTEGAVLLSPHREGTLRVLSAPGPRPWYVLESFRAGMWHQVGGSDF